MIGRFDCCWLEERRLKKTSKELAPPSISLVERVFSLLLTYIVVFFIAEIALTSRHNLVYVFNNTDLCGSNTDLLECLRFELLFSH